MASLIKLDIYNQKELLIFFIPICFKKYLIQGSGLGTNYPSYLTLKFQFNIF